MLYPAIVVPAGCALMTAVCAHKDYSWGIVNAPHSTAQKLMKVSKSSYAQRCLRMDVSDHESHPLLVALRMRYLSHIAKDAHFMRGGFIRVGERQLPYLRAVGLKPYKLWDGTNMCALAVQAEPGPEPIPSSR